jgi:uncharacterized protein (DUF983 family)
MTTATIEAKAVGEQIEVRIVVEKCPHCGGEWKWYDGCLGYESLVCKKCGLDIQDIRVVAKGNIQGLTRI